MLTLNSILKATRQMAAFGERGSAGALDHLPARVQGKRDRRSAGAEGNATDAGFLGRRWDKETKTFRED